MFDEKSDNVFNDYGVLVDPAIKKDIDNIYQSVRQLLKKYDQLSIIELQLLERACSGFFMGPFTDQIIKRQIEKKRKDREAQ